MTSTTRLFFHTILMGVLLVALVTMFAARGGLFFQGELFVFLLLALLTVIGMVGFSQPWGRSVFFLAFLLYVANLVVVWLFEGRIFITLSVLALIGFFSSLPQPRQGRSSKTKEIPAAVEEEPHSMVYENPKKEFSPGKLVASKSSNRYHAPACDWAKRIKEERRVWFNDKESAWKQGYRAHSCLS
ncbi:hypothetical protein COV20_05385 [Candidatus Woesearchaeota archaeon CG10_big_fil_rev_8_21_14_0_10_45_16]|nr:MAG: hypothetical protein COV20_05385 [Candidatus Woesearchaeota archaeon CG10_big_fil_rev_8_21_14_0_10_45_16]